jgi:pyruvate dehydrogenase E1 component subunit alpha
MTELRAAPGTSPDGPGAGSDAEFHRHLLEDMLVARRASERLWNLQRQGRIFTVAPLTGQEAAVVGVVRALDLAHDWLAPYYRELVGMAALGDEFLEQVVMYWRGHPDGGHIPDGVLCLPPQISLGAQIPHATGIAWGLKLQGKPGVACTFIGDGATSEGDFYEGLNLAGVHHVPLLVVVLNNGWAISTPTSRQTAAPTLAAKAEAVGVPSARADGNDVLAVVEAARAARTRAASGEGPQLLELVTYRMGAHTNSDDPTRYVPPAELAAWKERDPIEQFRRYLGEHGDWDDTAHQALVDEVEARLERVIDAAFEHPVDPNDALDHVTASDSPRLARERDELRGNVDGTGDSDDSGSGDEDGDISWRA